MDARHDTGSAATSDAVSSDQRSVTVRIGGHDVEVTYRWDRHEIDRRVRHGLRVLSEPGALRALMALPANLPVPANELDPLDRLVLGELPPGAIDDFGTHLVRRALPPVHLVQIDKHVRCWEDVQKLSLLRTHAPRLALASRSLADRIMRTCESDMGVGVVTDGCVIVERTPGRRWVKPSWQRWLLAETVSAVAGEYQPIRLSQT